MPSLAVRHRSQRSPVIFKMRRISGLVCPFSHVFIVSHRDCVVGVNTRAMRAAIPQFANFRIMADMVKFHSFWNLSFVENVYFSMCELAANLSVSVLGFSSNPLPAPIRHNNNPNHQSFNCGRLYFGQCIDPPLVVAGCAMRSTLRSQPSL